MPRQPCEGLPTFVKGKAQLLKQLLKPYLINTLSVVRECLQHLDVSLAVFDLVHIGFLLLVYRP